MKRFKVAKRKNKKFLVIYYFENVLLFFISKKTFVFNEVSDFQLSPCRTYLSIVENKLAYLIGQVLIYFSSSFSFVIEIGAPDV